MFGQSQEKRGKKMCKYCQPNYKTIPVGTAHGEQLVIIGGTQSNRGMSVHIWNGGILNIEAPADDLYAVIKIKYCPMCGRQQMKRGETNNEQI